MQQAVIRWRWAFIGCLILIMVMSLMPVNGTGWFPGQDKLMHTISFAVLFLLGSQAFHGSTSYWPLFLGLLVYGALIEWLQGKTGYRSMEAWDVVADVFGLAIGRLIVVFLSYKKG
ncbi:MAG: VanZ family protein [Porticoccus sp.]